jgi:hypothetical protein
VGPGTDYRDFFNAFADLASRIHIATGNAGVTAQLRESLKGRSFHIESFVDFEQLRPLLGVGVIHGGHGTSLTCISTGLPAVILPGDNPERALNGERLANNGFGRVLGFDGSITTSWGDSVDVTGKVPEWRMIRSAVDEILASGLTVAARSIAERVQADFATATFHEIVRK